MSLTPIMDYDRIRAQIKYQPSTDLARTLANPHQVFAGEPVLVSDRGTKGMIYRYTTDFDDPSTNTVVISKRLREVITPAALEKVVALCEAFIRFHRGKPWVCQSLGYYFTKAPGGKGCHLNLINEFIEGTTLGALYDSMDTVPLAQLLPHAREVYVMCGLMEKEAIAHMDIKLDNIMIKETGQLVLIDFALFCSKDHDGLPQLWANEGTIGYMAPEAYEVYSAHASKLRTYKRRADIWSASMAFFEVVTEIQYFEEIFCYDALYEHEEARVIREHPTLATDSMYRVREATRLAMVAMAAQENIDHLLAKFAGDDFITVFLEGMTFNAEARPSGWDMAEKVMLLIDDL